MARVRKVAGLDIGSNSVKFLELKPYKKTFSVVKFGIANLPPESIIDGAIMNSSTVSAVISNLVRKYKIKTRDVAISVSGHSVIIKRINLPIMSDAELEESIQWEAEQYIPFDINDVNVDAKVLIRDKDSPSGQMEVLLVAAKKELVNDYFAVVKEAGLTPLIVDVDSFAIQNAFEVNYKTGPGEVVALADIGASFVNLIILKDGIPTFTRDISFGGNNYTEEIQKRANVSYDEANALKMGGERGGAGQEGIQPAVQSILDSISNSMATEIQRSLDFYITTSVDEKISRIYLSGGGSQVSGLPEIIERKIGIPVELMDPFKEIEINPKLLDASEIEKFRSMAAVVAGLAMRKLGD